MFDEALHEGHREYLRTHLQVTLLQYVNDLLIAGDTDKDCKVIILKMKCLSSHSLLVDNGVDYI